MELIAVGVMIVIGGAIALFIAAAVAIARKESGSDEAGAAADRDAVAASILYQVLSAGGASEDEVLRQLRRDAGLGARITPSIEITSWGESYARRATPRQRESLLETAVRLAAAPGQAIPLRQYCALLDLSFALGFQTDALARLREVYGFNYVDHAKNARTREADRGGGAAALFVREEADPREWLRVLEIEGTPTRQTIISAYRRLVARHHPDRFFDQPGEAQESAASRFIEITRAYEHLLAIYRD